MLGGLPSALLIASRCLVGVERTLSPEEIRLVAVLPTISL